MNSSTRGKWWLPGPTRFADQIEYVDGQYRVRIYDENHFVLDEHGDYRHSPLFPSRGSYEDKAIRNLRLPAGKAKHARFSSVRTDSSMQLVQSIEAHDGSALDQWLRCLGYPNTDRNRFHLCKSSHGAVLIDSISLLQVALDMDLETFSLLVNPLRDLIVTAWNDGSITFLSINFQLCTGYPAGMPLAMLQSLAYWLACPVRLSSLLQFSISIQSNQHIHLPGFDFTIKVSLEGWKAGSVILVDEIRRIQRSWWLGPDHVVVILNRLTPHGFAIGSSAEAIADASESLLGDRSLLGSNWGAETVLKLHQVLHAQTCLGRGVTR